ELQLLDGLLRRVHRDDRRRDDAVLESAELLGREHVVGATDASAQPRVRHAVIPEAGRRVDNTKVDPEVVQALVQQAGQHRRRPVEDVLAGRPPEGLLAYPAPPPLGQGHPERAGDAVASDRQSLGRGVPTDALELLAHDGRILEPVAVGVDDRMVQARAKLPGVGRTVGEHGDLQASSIRCDDTRLPRSGHYWITDCSRITFYVSDSVAE